MDAYCLKCREKREMVDPQPYEMKNKKMATTGTCPVCGTKMFKIGKAAPAA
jgi:Zn finger protein HypA/HybF involved in hydrogenase expression